MKKSIIIVLSILVVIALLPIIGNSFMSKTIDERLTQLKSYGLETTSSETNSTYLNTSKHFEFLLKDSHKFVNYLKQYSDEQIPPYVHSMLDGVLLGADIEYSNFPFAKAVTIEIYPLTLSHDMQESVRDNDLEFFTYIDKFLHSKGFLYHINYNLLNDDFDGYVKDIDETYKLNDGLELDISLKKATFRGNGVLIAPNQLRSKVKELQVSAVKDSKKLNLTIHKFSSKSNFESQNTYITSAEFKNMEILISGTVQDLNVSMVDIKLNGSSNDQSEESELNSRLAVKSMSLEAEDMAFKLKGLVLDVALNGLNKEKYEELRLLVSKNNNLNSPVSQRELQGSALSVLEKGLVFEIAEFSLKNIDTKALGELNGFDIKSRFTLKPDASLKQKVRMSPLLALSNIDVTTNIKMSKEIYNQLLNNQSMLASVTKYAKIDGDDYVFNITFIDSKIVINGQALN